MMGIGHIGHIYWEAVLLEGFTSRGSALVPMGNIVLVWVHIGLETLGPIHWRVSFCVQHHNFGALNVHPAPIGDGMEFRPPNNFLGRTQCFRGSFGMQNPSVFHGNHWEEDTHDLKPQSEFLLLVNPTFGARWPQSSTMAQIPMGKVNWVSMLYEFSQHLEKGCLNREFLATCSILNPS